MQKRSSDKFGKGSILTFEFYDSSLKFYVSLLGTIQILSVLESLMKRFENALMFFEKKVSNETFFNT